jgi:hypothetical protein
MMVQPGPPRLTPTFADAEPFADAPLRLAEAEASASASALASACAAARASAAARRASARARRAAARVSRSVRATALRAVFVARLASTLAAPCPLTVPAALPVAPLTVPVTVPVTPPEPPMSCADAGGAHSSAAAATAVRRAGVLISKFSSIDCPIAARFNRKTTGAALLLQHRDVSAKTCGRLDETAPLGRFFGGGNFAWEGLMPTYTFRLHTADERLAREEIHSCLNDDAAFKLAHVLLAQQPVVMIWRGGWMLRRVTRSGAGNVDI